MTRDIQKSRCEIRRRAFAYGQTVTLGHPCTQPEFLSSLFLLDLNSCHSFHNLTLPFPVPFGVRHSRQKAEIRQHRPPAAIINLFVGPSVTGSCDNMSRAARHT